MNCLFWDGVCALEAALVDHNLALRRFICEWVERQEQLLSQKTMMAPNPPGEHCVQGEGQLARLTNDDMAFAIPVPPGRVAEKNGHHAGTLSDPISEQVHGHVVAPLVEAEDMIKEPHTSERAADGSSQVATSKVTWHESMLPSPESPQLSRQAVQGVVQWSYSARDYLDNLSEMDICCDCLLINRLEESRVFDVICGLVIVLNAISMAVAADYEMQNFQQPTNEILVRIELAFVIVYTVELVIRITAKRLKFFFFPWSWFDLVIVAVGWMEVVSSSSTSLTQVRMMRILKMMKVMRVLRVMRSLREVRLLLNSLMGSVKPLLWTVFIITGINFMFGICFVQSIAALRHDIWNNGGGGDGQPEPEQLEMLYSAWGSVPQAMYTLFKVSTGGVSWGEVSDPLLATTGWSTFVIFLLYIAFFMFVMTNAVTAIFVSSAEEYASKDSHNMLYDQLQAKTEYMTRVVPLYREMDCDGNGEVTKAEFSKYINDPRMIAFASSLEIDTMDLDQFFDVLSSRGEMPVDLDTFVDGCIRLRGAARSMDVYDMLIQHRALSQEVGIIRSLLERLPVTTLK